MNKLTLSEKGSITIRQLKKDENIPCYLLLLADERIEAINKYVNNSEIYISEFKNKIIAVYVIQRINKDN